MFKFTLKLTTVTLLLVVAGLLLSGGKVAAATCASAPGSHWGVTTGQHGNAMAGLKVYAHVGAYTSPDPNTGATAPSNAGDPLNVGWELNSYLPGAPQRIFKYPPGSGGRDSQHWFRTGETITGGTNGSQSYQCDGWDVLGPGQTIPDPNNPGQYIDQIGNGWVLDCGNGGTATEFWISDIDNISGESGHWEVQVDGVTYTNSLDTNPMLHFTVTNGDTRRIDLIWHKNPPQRRPSQGNCNYLDIYNEGTFTNAGGNHPTRAHVQVSGVTGVSENGGASDWSQHSVDGYAPDANGDYSYKDKVWRYTAEQPTITITVTKQAFYGNGVNAQWYTIAGGWSQTRTCISTSCAITSVVDRNNRPGGVIAAGDQVHVSGYIVNTSPPDGPYLNWPYLTGTGGNSNGAGVLGPNGGSGNVSLDITAPGSPQYWTLSYSVAGVPATATCPSVTVPVYQFFNASGGAHSQLLPTKENPDHDNYYTNVVISGTGYAVNLTTNSKLAKNGVTLPPPPTTTNSGGQYAGTTYTLGGGPAGADYPVATVNGSDQYCASINISPTSGYVGPAHDVVGPSGNQTWTDCDRETNEPYFKVFGSGVTARDGVVDSTGNCSANATNSGLLAGWNDNQDGPGVDRGSGSQLSSLALIKITGVASAQTSIIRPPTDLTFANIDISAGDITSSLDSPSLGGDFSGTPVCNTPPKAQSGATDLTNPAALPASGNYKYSGNLTLSGTTISGATELFVDGDVFINSDITYNQAGWSPGNVPSFVLVATGNIYVAPGVTQLDGVYVAQPKDATTGGTIYTCAQALSSTNFKVDNDFTNCKNQLVVSGSFTASKVKLLRTFGSLRDEAPSGGSPFVPPVLAVPGAVTPLDWSSSGTITGETCKNINEPSEPRSRQWNDNYLCVPAADSAVQLGWTSTGNTSGLKAQGLSYCTTAWGAFAGKLSSKWNDNYLCSNAPISLVSSPTGGQYCTPIKELSDNKWPSNAAYVCVQKPNPGSPGIPAVPPTAPGAPACSNKGLQILANTCAAEVFQFSPELYLTVPDTKPPSAGAMQFDAITNLPPVL